jgi:hypothetical protein
MCSCCVAGAADGCSTKLCNQVMRLRRNGYTPLRLTLCEYHVDVMKLLLEHGTAINTEDL